MQIVNPYNVVWTPKSAHDAKILSTEKDLPEQTRKKQKNPPLQQSKKILSQGGIFYFFRNIGSDER